MIKTGNHGATTPDKAVLRAVQAGFLHERLLWSLMPPEEESRARALIEQRSQAIGRPAARIGVLEEWVARLLASTRCTALPTASAAGPVEPGALVAIKQTVDIRKDASESGQLSAVLNGPLNIEVRGTFSTSRLTGMTAIRAIWGTHEFSILAFAETDSSKRRYRIITVRPIFIGWELETAIDQSLTRDRGEVWPDEIDQFSQARLVRATTQSDLRRVGRLPEQAVKQAFAEIIGEHCIPRDWGGESSDLFTAQLTMRGQGIAAAFAFKGPGTRGRLYIAGLGKRGDQAVRLADEPADLLVIQHHGEIDPMVRRQLQALAQARGKRFMVLDGQATARLLKAYDKLPPNVTI
jgi:hypothetical protein